MRVFSLASGSKGNAYVVEHEGVELLIDCGLSFRQLSARATAMGLDEPVAVLVTHSHRDHIAGLVPLLGRFPSLRIYANELTAEAVGHELKLDEGAFAIFENRQPFEIGPFVVLPFPIPHDTGDPVGYLVKAGTETYFHGTDIGYPLPSIGERLSQADYAVLESNHDERPLFGSGRPESVIQRIAGPRGHLSNEQACELVRDFASPRLKLLALAHLSRDCNLPHLAQAAMSETLKSMGRAEISLKILSQDEPVEI